jgi:hypothetical protein
MSYNLKITVHNNRDYEQPFILKDDAGVVIDLTGCKLSFGYGTTTKVLGTHITSGGAANLCIFITNAVAGEFKLVLPHAVLKTLSPGIYEHDLVLIGTDNKRTGIWAGQMVVKKGLA